MGLTNVAKNALATAAATGTLPVTAWGAASYFGVGDATTAYAAAQTDLQAATNKFRRLMDIAPTDSGAGVLTYRATFLATEANFTWNEWGIFNALSGGQMLTRNMQSLGAKPGTEIWQVTATLTFVAG